MTLEGCEGERRPGGQASIQTDDAPDEDNVKVEDIGDAEREAQDDAQHAGPVYAMGPPLVRSPAMAPSDGQAKTHHCP